MAGLGPAGMRSFAEQQYALGRYLLEQHREGLPGVCASCGRQMPCDERDRGEQLTAQYARWSQPAGPPAEDLTGRDRLP